MDELVGAASIALIAIDKFTDEHDCSPLLDSIKNQMQFIHDAAKAGRNPLEMVSSDSPFTFGILSSREFASPTEMEIKERLDSVTAALARI